MLSIINHPYKPEPAPSDFRREFQLLYDRSPLRAVKMFLYYLGVRGADQLAHYMAYRATVGDLYISVLLENDPLAAESLSNQNIAAAVPLLPTMDSQFLLKLARGAAELTNAVAILRALRLVPTLGDYSILTPWLRTLDTHADGHIRSQAAKLLCRLRPSDGFISSHLQSRDARIRASVIEALWNPKMARTDFTLLQFLRASVDDANHRVVANALVGLYRLGDSQAMDKIVDLSATKPHLLRASMAWAMGMIDDPRAVVSLRRLLHDPSFTVRTRAANSLSALGISIDAQSVQMVRR